MTKKSQIKEVLELSPFYPTLSEEEVDLLIKKIQDELVLEPPSQKEVVFPH